MTSKALEAAMQADWELTREPYDPPNVADADPWYRDDLRKKTVFVIRAFAQNISEEAADVVGVEIHERDSRGFDVFPAYEKAGGQYRTFGRNLISLAIEKDLE